MLNRDFVLSRGTANGLEEKRRKMGEKWGVDGECQTIIGNNLGSRRINARVEVRQVGRRKSHCCQRDKPGYNAARSVLLYIFRCEFARAEAP